MKTTENGSSQQETSHPSYEEGGAERLRILFEISQDGIAIFNQEHRIIDANARFAEMLGYPLEDVLNLHTWDFEANLTESQIRTGFADLSNIHKIFETRHRRKDGTVYDAEVSASGACINGENVIITFTRDITERKQVEQQIEHLAFHDQLTGLLNRKRFFDLGDREIERNKRTGGELWVLMLDIDHFKKINDTAGHGMGDRVLIAIGDLLNRSVRKVDLVVRFGGEEFAAILADTNRAGCEHVAENIRQSVESLQVPGWTDIHSRITVSIGCALLGEGDTLDAALQAADKALYRSKNNGRNQVSF